MEYNDNGCTAVLHIFREINIPLEIISNPTNLKKSRECSEDSVARFLEDYLLKNSRRKIEEFTCKNKIIRDLVAQLKNNINFSAISYLFIMHYDHDIIADRNEVAVNNYNRIQELLGQDIKTSADISELGHKVRRFIPAKISRSIEKLCNESRSMIHGVKTLRIFTNDLTVPWELDMLGEDTFLAREINVEISGLFNLHQELPGNYVPAVISTAGTNGVDFSSLRFLIFATTDFPKTAESNGIEDYINYIEGLKERYPDQIKLIENYRKSSIEKDILAEVDFDFINSHPQFLFFTGHLVFNPDNPLKSEIFYHDRTMRNLRYTITDVFKESEKFPEVLFLNACDSIKTNIIYDTSRDDNLFQYFFSRGVKRFIGAQWEIESGSAHVFCKFFLDNFVNKKMNIQNSMHLARLATADEYNTEEAESTRNHMIEERDVLINDIDSAIAKARNISSQPPGFDPLKEQYKSNAAGFEAELEAIPDCTTKQEILEKIATLKLLEPRVRGVMASGVAWATYRLITSGDATTRFEQRFQPVLGIYIPPVFKNIENMFKEERISSLIFDKIHFATYWTGKISHFFYDPFTKREVKVAIMPWFEFIDLKISLATDSGAEYRIIGEIRDEKPETYGYFYKIEKSSWSDMPNTLHQDEDRPVFFYPKDDYYGMLLFRFQFLSQFGFAIPRTHYLFQQKFAAEYENLPLVDVLIESPDFQGIIARAGTKEYESLKAKKSLREQSLSAMPFKLPRYVIVLESWSGFENIDPYVQEILDIMQSITNNVAEWPAGMTVETSIIPDGNNLDDFSKFLRSNAVSSDPLITKLSKKKGGSLTRDDYFFLDRIEKLKSILKPHIAEKSFMASKQKEKMARRSTNS